MKGFLFCFLRMKVQGEDLNIFEGTKEVTSRQDKD